MIRDCLLIVRERGGPLSYHRSVTIKTAIVPVRAVSVTSTGALAEDALITVQVHASSLLLAVRITTKE